MRSFSATAGLLIRRAVDWSQTWYTEKEPRRVNRVRLVSSTHSEPSEDVGASTFTETHHLVHSAQQTNTCERTVTS